MNRPFWSFRTSASSDDCESIEPLLSLAADGMASAEETRRVNAHLPACADCRAALSWMQVTHTTLASRPVAVPPPDLHSRIALAIALSSRPVAVPPPDLHSRIALAIAASSAAPVSLRPARVFALRAVYAAAASVSVLGALLSYGLLHSPSEVAVKHPANPTTVAVVPTVKIPVAPKLAERPLVASAPAKSITIKHTVIARKTAPLATSPQVHTASNDVPTKLSAAPQAIKAPVHPGLIAPKLMAHSIVPIEKHSIETHSIEKHAPLPTRKTVAPKLIEGPQVAKVLKEQPPVPTKVDKTTITNDVPARVASAHEAPSSASSDPLGSFKAQHQTASAIPIHYSVPQTYRVVTRMIQTVGNDEHTAFISAVHGNQ